MPNYVLNKLVIIGNEANRIAGEILTTEDDKKIMDFNNIIKMPDGLDVVCGGITNPAADYYLASINPRCKTVKGKKWSEEEFDEYIAKVNDTLTKETELHGENKYSVDKEFFTRAGKSKKEFLEYGKNIAENRVKYHASTWYEWSISVWGCKWNACDSSVNLSFRQAEIWFETPWVKPAGVMKELFKKYKDADATFIYDWSEEQIGVDEGHIIISHDDILELDSYSDKRKATKHGRAMWGC